MSAPPAVLYAGQVISTVAEGQIDQLKKLAFESPLKRARLCLHLSNGDLVQEMVIVLHRDTYLRPHRHQNKTESFHMIEGAVAVCFFEEDGSIRQTLRLEANRESVFLYRLSEALWHTVVPLTEYAVFHEVATGPFSPSEYPDWEPQRDAPSLEAFREKILRFL